MTVEDVEKKLAEFEKSVAQSFKAMSDQFVNERAQFYKEIGRLNDEIRRLDKEQAFFGVELDKCLQVVPDEKGNVVQSASGGT